MDKNTAASKAASALSKARWKNTSKEDKEAHMAKMREARKTPPADALRNWWATATTEQKEARSAAARLKRWGDKF